MPDVYIGEELCKVVPVQDELSFVWGGYIFFQAIIGNVSSLSELVNPNFLLILLEELIAAFPCAALCERFNRRTMLLANLTSDFIALIWMACTCMYRAMLSYIRYHFRDPGD